MKTLANEPRLKFPFYCKNYQSIMPSKLGIKGLSAPVKRIWFIQSTAALGNVDEFFFFFFCYCMWMGLADKIHTDPPLFFLATHFFPRVFSTQFHVHGYRRTVHLDRNYEFQH
jgi:hypothetical protein